MGSLGLSQGIAPPGKSGEAMVGVHPPALLDDATPSRLRPRYPGTHGFHRSVARERRNGWSVRILPLRVVIADPNGLVRLGLSASLRSLDDVEIVGEASDLDGLVALLEKDRPGLAVVDLVLPGLARHEDLTAPMREVVDDLKVIVVSDSTTDTAVVRTFRAEANGFVVKQDAQEMLPLAVTAVRRGGTFVDPEVASILIALVSKGQRSYEGPFGLTVQEQRVAVLLAEGMSNREIGEQLGITPGTVKTHVANAVSKLGAHDRYEAADIVRREEITPPGA